MVTEGSATTADSSIKASTQKPVKHTKHEIRVKYFSLPFDTNSDVCYSVTPSITPPYKAGAPCQATMTDGINAVNLVRYVAGIPYDVELKAEYSELTQHASVVNAANKTLSHNPSKPDGMSAEFFDKGYTGASRSNLAYGYGNIANSIINGYMDDSDSSNIDRAGHRRWILNPYMKYTGFGVAAGYSALYAFDRSRSENCNYDFVCWPAQTMPVELYMGNAFSVSFSPSTYDPLDYDKVSVTMKNRKTGAEYTLNSSTANSNGQYFNVNNDGYGVPQCVIFRPSYTAFLSGDIIDISITGLTNYDEPKSLSYTVEFFSAEDLLLIENGAAVKLTGLTAKSTETSVDLSWNKIEGVSGYWIYKLNPADDSYDLVKTVSGSDTATYCHTGLKSGTVYEFSVQAYKNIDSVTYHSNGDVVKVSTKLTAPTALKAAASHDSVKLTWDAVKGADRYAVYRAVSETGTYTRLGSTASLNYTDKSPQTGKTYYYRVRAYKTVDGVNVYGPASKTVAAKPLPTAPTGVKAVRASYKSIKISWTAVSGATGYAVYRATSKTGTYNYIKSTASTSLTDTSCTTGKTYYYKVKAYKTVGDKKYHSGDSTIVSAKAIPTAPTGVKAVSASYKSIKISWSAVSGATGYAVYRATSKTGTYNYIKSTASTSLTDTSCTTGKTYYYKVKAYKTVGDKKYHSGDSAIVCAKAANTNPGISAYEKQVVTLVNKERQKNGLPALTINAKLSQMARIKSQDMHDHKYFSHTSPTYGSPFDMMETFGISYMAAGENIAMGFETPEAVVEAWMNSPGHRTNILNVNFTQIGVGYVKDGHYWTQDFIG